MHDARCATVVWSRVATVTMATVVLRTASCRTTKEPESDGAGCH